MTRRHLIVLCLLPFAVRMLNWIDPPTADWVELQGMFNEGKPVSMPNGRIWRLNRTLVVTGGGHHIRNVHISIGRLAAFCGNYFAVSLGA